MHLNRLLSQLGPAAREAMRPHLRRTALAADQIVMREGEPAEELCFPESAVLSCLRIMADGRAVVVGMTGREGAAGLLSCLSDTAMTSRVVATAPGDALLIRASVLESLACCEVQLRRVLLEAVAVQAREQEQDAVCNALHDATRRLARWLLRTQDRVGSAIFPLTQEHMARVLGVQRTTANGRAMHLRRSGVIHYRRGVIHILDRPGLEALACECHGAAAAVAALPERERRAG